MNASKISFFINYSFKIILFVRLLSCNMGIDWNCASFGLVYANEYLLLLLDIETKQLDIIYGILLIISGAYQFSPLKTTLYWIL